MPDKTKFYSKFFKALGDENRLKILYLVFNGANCPCRLLRELPIEQSTLSHHMKILCDAGIVEAKKNGTKINYSINSEVNETVKTFIDDLIA